MSAQENQNTLSQSLSYLIGAEQGIVLPSLVKPKLVVPGCALSDRWRLSGFYPAFRLRAKLWRTIQRCRLLSGLAPIMPADRSHEFRQFIGEVFPDITHTAVLLGTPGPNRKVIVQLWQNRRLTAYLKVAATDSAAVKIRSEVTILESLPAGLGPSLLKVGELDGRMAIMLSPVEGKMFPAKLSAAVDICRLTIVKEYLDRLNLSDKTYEIDEHPAITRLREQASEAGVSSSTFEDWLTPLRARKWGAAFMHGDFAPWNLFCQPDGSLRAIDWEEGVVDGFPHFDLIHFISQTAALCHGWSSDRTFHYLRDLLGDQLDTFTIPIIRLGMLNSFAGLQKSLDESHWSQAWRKKIWEVPE